MSDVANNTVGKCDAITGAVIKASFITGLNEPTGLVIMPPQAFGSLGYLLLSSFGNNTVGKYDTNTGAKIDPNFITGLLNVGFIAVKSAK